jgi:hypothetical protein
VPLRVRNPAAWARLQNRITVEAWTRQRAEQAAKMPMSAPSTIVPFAGESCTSSSTCAANEVCHNKKCATSVTLNPSAFSAAKSMTAVVKKKGKYAALLVDQVENVPAATVDKVLDQFDKVLFPRVTGLFGRPLLQDGGQIYATDRNGDGLVWIVMTPKVSEKMPAVGFFDRMDFADSASSNKADIMWVDTTQASLSYIYATVGHELQHLLSYASRVYKPVVNGGQGSLETLWLDEGLAHLSEGLSGYGGGNVTLLGQEAFPNFESSTLFTPDKNTGDGDTAAMRGMAYMYLRYLFEQRGGVSFNSDGTLSDNGGATFLKSLHTSSQKGADLISATYGDYKAAFGNWIAAISLDGRKQTTDSRYGYQPMTTDPVTGKEQGLVVRGTAKDEDDTEQLLEGPLETEITGDQSDKIPNGTGKFFLLKGKTGNVNVQVTSQMSDFNFAVVRVKK